MDQTRMAFGIAPARRKSLAIAVSATAATAAALCGAQPAHAELEEIIVTATKRSENLQNIAQSVQAFTTDDIRTQRLIGIDDYSKKIPALSFVNREPGGLSVVFRGVSVSGLAFGENASSSVYLDEQPVTASGRNINPRLIDIERLEALSGPQGTLFGDSSQSGALRIITNKPDPDAASAWLEAEVNGYEEGDAGYDLSGMANVPLVPGKLALRLVGFSVHEAGYIDNVKRPSLGGTFDNAAVAKDDVNSADIYGGRAQLRWFVNEDWTADFTGIFEHKSVDGFSDINRNIDLGDLEQRRYERESTQDEWYQLALTVEGPVAGLDGTFAVSYFDRDFRYEADATDYEFSLQRSSCGRYPGGCAGAFGEPGSYSFYDFGGDPHGYATNREATKRWSMESRVATPGDSSSRWSGVAGVFYNKEKGKTLFRSYARGFGDTDFFSYLNYLAYVGNGSYKDPTDNWWVGAYDRELEQKAVFGELSFALTERLSITAGGRWYDVSDDFYLVNGGIQDGWPDPNEAPIYTNVDVGSGASGTVGKLSLKWQITDDHMVYATYSEGFRGGGGNPIRRDSKLPTTFDADFLYNYEVGAKTRWLDGMMRLNLTAYHMDWIDIQVQVEDPRPAVYALAFVNFPEATIDGIEVELQWMLTDNLEFNASMAHLDAQISKTSTLFPRSPYPFTVLKGTTLPVSPDFKANLSLQYNLPQQMFGAAPYARVDYSYTGESYNSVGSEAVIADAPPARQDNYMLLDIGLGLDAEGWNAQFFIENVLDERAEQFFNNRWGTSRLSINPPRSLGVSFRKNFDL
jgi:outer membrane receptor protein involved in Fe transport